jgi:hypothetical protein
VKKIPIIFFLCFGWEANAGIGEDLETFFNAIGMTSNVTSPGAHKDQSAGYYSGGGISTRSRVRNYSLANLQLPNFKAGCGAGGKHEEVARGKSGKNEFKDILADEFNVAWEVIKRQIYF